MLGNNKILEGVGRGDTSGALVYIASTLVMIPVTNDMLKVIYYCRSTIRIGFHL